MSEPVDLLSIQDLQTALQGIRENDGYFYGVAASAVKLDPNQAVDELVVPGGARPFVLIEVRNDTMTFVEKPDGIKHLFELTIHWVSESEPTDDTDRMRVFFRGCADVEKAITVDRSRGGLAFDTLIRRRQLDTGVDGSQVWARVDVDLDIRRTYGVPI